MVKEAETHVTVKLSQTDIEIRMQVFAVGIDIIVVIIIKGDIYNLRYLLPCCVCDILYCRHNVLECLHGLHRTLGGVNVIERQEAVAGVECRVLCRCLICARVVVGMVDGIIEAFLSIRLTEYGRDELSRRWGIVASCHVYSDRRSLCVRLLSDRKGEYAFCPL